jgi:hypothetical protein
MLIRNQMWRASTYVDIARAATRAETALAIGAQSLRAGAVSAGAWGMRGAVISVSGWVGGLAGVALLRLYRDTSPHGGDGDAQIAGEDPLLATAKAGGVFVGRAIGVIFGGAFLGAAQTLGERASTDLRLYCGHGLENDVVAPHGPRPAQLLTTGAFCTAGLLRGYIEPSIAEFVPGVAPIVRTVALDVISSGATSCLAQLLVSVYDARPEGTDAVTLRAVRRQPALDAEKIRLGWRTVMVGLPFDIMPAGARTVAHALGMGESQGQSLSDVAEGVCAVAGTLVRLNTWFHYREPGSDSVPAPTPKHCAISIDI